LAGWWPLVFVAVAPLLLAALRAPPWRSWLIGFFTGLACNLFLFYWILIVLGSYDGKPWWISAFALVLPAVYMACYQAIFCLFLSFIVGRSRFPERAATALVCI
jgi:apolipoprotein N-acyltransferase